MKENYSKSLPKTAGEISNGGVYRQAVRCGKAACHCFTGDLHEGYHYYIRRERGRLRKTYIPKNLVGEITALVDEARAELAEEYAISRASRRLFAEFCQSLREHRDSLSSEVEDA